MGIKKLYTVVYTDYAHPEMLGQTLIDGYDEDDVRETFSLIYDGIEIIEIICESEED